MKFVYPVIAGLLATFVIGLLLIPVVYIVFNTFFELYVLTEPSPGAWINDLIVIITGVLWLLAASGADSFFAAITGLHLRILHLSHLYQAEIIFHGFQICIFFKNGAYSRFV